jgi:hypothetical protein
MLIDDDDRDPGLLDEDELAEPDELTAADLNELHGGDGPEGEDPELLWRIGQMLDQEATAATDPDLVLAARMAGGDLWRMSDADVMKIAVKCREVAARAQGRMYRALEEFQRRRPPRRRHRRGERVQEMRDKRDGIGDDAPSAPRRAVMASAEAASEVALAFTATEYAAEKMIAITADLSARLPLLHLELEAGRTDEDRMKILWEGTRDLSDEDAGKVDALLSARSGQMTTGGLRDTLRRAVIKIDPAAAERRRKRAERKARVRLYANPSHTATLALEDVPAAPAAAAKARVSAIARAAKSAGAAEDIGLLEAKTAMGLLLGTLTLIPPRLPPDGGSGDAGPDDSAPGDAGPDRDGPPGGGGPDERPDPGEDLMAEPVAESMPWPTIPDTPDAAAPGCAPIPAGLRAHAGRARLLIPWRTMAAMASEPGELSWFGPATAGQARELARAAAADRAARWFLVVTDDQGHAIAITTLRNRHGAQTPGLIDEVTVTITASLAAGLDSSDEMRHRVRQLLAGLDPAVAGLLQDAIGAASKAAADTELRAILDEAAGGCAHTLEVPGYRVPGTMRRWLNARDRTCRNPICRRRATQCDMDHTLAYDKGGRTCPCGLGALCRLHHRVKQLPGWHLSQDARGYFTWTTPAGLTYRKEPHEYAV